MTSRRSPPRRSSGSRAPLTARRALAVVLALVVVAALRAATAAAGPAGPLLEDRDGIEIDWASGTVTAGAGAAPDLRMPSADVARAGAVRRAEAAARARLIVALAALPLGGGRKPTAEAVERAVGRARLSQTDYQSNGGALVRVTARFSDWLEHAPAAPPVMALAVPAMRLAAAPLAKLGGHDSPLGAAVYRVGAPPREAKAFSAKVDHAGRIVIEGAPKDAALAQKLAQGTSVIYVEKVLR